jgi:hypothetical protein
VPVIPVSSQSALGSSGKLILVAGSRYDPLDLVRSRKVEQEVLEIIDGRKRPFEIRENEGWRARQESNLYLGFRRPAVFQLSH